MLTQQAWAAQILHIPKKACVYDWPLASQKLNSWNILSDKEWLCIPKTLDHTVPFWPDNLLEQYNYDEHLLSLWGLELEYLRSHRCVCLEDWPLTKTLNTQSGVPCWWLFAHVVTHHYGRNKACPLWHLEASSGFCPIYLFLLLIFLYILLL